MLSPRTPSSEFLVGSSAVFYCSGRDNAKTPRLRASRATFPPKEQLCLAKGLRRDEPGQMGNHKPNQQELDAGSTLRASAADDAQPIVNITYNLNPL